MIIDWEKYRVDTIDNIKTLCKNNGLTWEGAAQRAGLGVNNIYNWMSGSFPSLQSVIILADFFHISIDELIGRTREDI